jgi:TonB family protein
MATPDKLEFGLLPERRMDWRTFATSYGLEALLILLLMGAGFIFPDTLRLRQRYTVTDLIPRPDLKPEPVKPKPKVHHPTVVAKLPPPVAFPTAKLFVPKDIPRQKKKEDEEKAPQLEAKFKAPDLQPASALPAKIIYTGAFGSSAPATVNAPIEKVQTGGFGDPNGLPGQGKDNAHLTATKMGSFDLPEGPGNGNGAGGAKGIKGTIASAGFGNGIALGDNRGNRGTSVQTAGFGAQEVSHNGAKAAQVDSGPATTQVEIISKPSPVYTQEARRLRLEGEVLLEVLFTANGQMRVNRVVRGLGHGLDEAAITAANQMRFKPALRNGSPVDSTAIVHVVFQMAY